MVSARVAARLKFGTDDKRAVERIRQACLEGRLKASKNDLGFWEIDMEDLADWYIRREKISAYQQGQRAELDDAWEATLAKRRRLSEEVKR